MTISLRLDHELNQKLEQAARREGISKSDLVRRCIEQQLAEPPAEILSAWELGKDLFGKVSSGREDLSVNAEAILREKIHAQARRR